MTKEYYALGWLVLGEGMSITDAEWKIQDATFVDIEEWSDKQRAALQGFGRWIRRLHDKEGS